MIKVNNKTVSKMYFQKGGTSADAFLPVEIKRVYYNEQCVFDSGWLQLTSPSLTESMEIKSQNDGIVNINCIDNLDLSADYLHNSYISNKSYF